MVQQSEQVLAITVGTTMSVIHELIYLCQYAFNWSFQGVPTYQHVIFHTCYRVNKIASNIRNRMKKEKKKKEKIGFFPTEEV